MCITTRICLLVCFYSLFLFFSLFLDKYGEPLDGGIRDKLGRWLDMTLEGLRDKH